ncbi:hypothetical protein BJ742DRAFT_849373 [Cladochytrium replicatum]|nr:hypothetical protein BJ742DRAFT_849373 [Cladochytrium replicatum]
MSNQDHPPSYDAAVSSAGSRTPDHIRVQHAALEKASWATQSDNEDGREVSSESAPLLPPRNDDMRSTPNYGAPGLVPPHNDSVVYVPPVMSRGGSTVRSGDISRGILGSPSPVIVLREAPAKKKFNWCLCIFIFLFVIALFGKFESTGVVNGDCARLDPSNKDPTVFSFDVASYSTGTNLVIEKPNRTAIDLENVSLTSQVIIEPASEPFFSFEVQIDSTIEGFKMVQDASANGVYTLKLHYEESSVIIRRDYECVSIRTVVKIPAGVAKHKLFSIQNQNGSVKVASESGMADLIMPKEVRITSSNGSIRFVRAHVGLLYLTTTNARVDVLGITGTTDRTSSPRVEVNSSNGDVSVSAISDVFSILVKTTNGRVVADDINVNTNQKSQLQIYTRNGKISASRVSGYVIVTLSTSNDVVAVSNLVGPSESRWRGERVLTITTSNSRCEINDVQNFDTVKVQTTNGGVRTKKVAAGEVWISTSTASVDLQELAIGNVLSVKTSSGSVRAGRGESPVAFDDSLRLYSSKQIVTVSTSTGSIDYYAPSSYIGAFDLSTSSSEKAEVYSSSSDLKLTQSSRSKKVGYKVDRNNSRPSKITLHTTSGRVDLIFVTPWLSLVGADPGDHSLLTENAFSAISQADLIVADRLLYPCMLTFIRTHQNPRAENPDSAQTSPGPQTNLQCLRSTIGDHTMFVFGLGAEEPEVLKGVAASGDVIPGISSALAAPMYAEIPVTFSRNRGSGRHRDRTQARRGRSCRGEWDKDTLVLLMAHGTIRSTVDALLSRLDYPVDLPAAVIDRATWENEEQRQRSGGGEERVLVGKLVELREFVIKNGILHRSTIRWNAKQAVNIYYYFYRLLLDRHTRETKLE